MKNQIIKGVLVAYVMSVIIACTTKKAEPLTIADKEQIKKEIQSKENEFAELYNTREIKNIGYYAEDATSFSQNKPALVGKNAIVDFLIANMDSIPLSNKISFTTNELFISDDGAQVVEIGYYKVVDSDSTTVNSGNYMSIFEKRNGKYVCVRDMSTSDLPVE
jgi:ketosteroid isomerase-like protein